MKTKWMIPFSLCMAVMFTAACKREPQASGMKLSGGEVAPMAKLEVADTVDMGVFYTDNTVKTKDITLTNVGEATLYLNEALPECECTTAELLDSILEPGQTGTVRVSLDLTGYIPPMTVDKRFAILCNSENDRVVYVTLVGKLER